MKINNFENSHLGQQVSNTTFIQQQEAFFEVIEAVFGALGVNSTVPVILYGLNNDLAAPDYQIRKGMIVYQNEVFYVDAFAGNDALLVPVFKEDFQTVGDPVIFADRQYRDVHFDRKYKLELDASGSGLSDWSATLRIDAVISGLLGWKEYTDQQINDLVNGAGASLDTLNELSQALNNDPDFATNIINQIAQKASQADHDDLDNRVSANETIIANIEDYRSKVFTSHPGLVQVDHSIDNYQNITGGKTLVFSGARIPAANVVVAPGGSRVITASVDFYAHRSGSDPDYFIAVLKYRIGSGGYTELRRKRQYADGPTQVLISAPVQLDATPADYVEFALEIENLNATSVQITNDSSIILDCVVS